MGRKVNLSRAFAAFSEHWAPRRVGVVNDTDIKIARLEGRFVWHSHPVADEMFLVLEGTLALHFRDRTVMLGAGELFIVPRGIEHCPETIDGPCRVMLVEPAGTVNTGDAAPGERTVPVLEDLR